MRKSSLRWYYGGFIGIVVAVLAFQLIWLPAPYVLSPQLEWIEVINWLYYAVLFIPICWLLGAVQSLRQLKKEANKSKLKVALHYVIAAASAALLLVLKQPLQYLIAALITLVIAVFVIAIAIGYELGIKRGAIYALGYAAIMLLLLCPTGYNVTYPAMTMNMNSYAKLIVEQEETTEQGWIDGVLVFERPAFPIDWLYVKTLPLVELQKRQANEPGISETYSQVVQMKQDANQLAIAIAWEQAGRGDAIQYDGVQVAAIMEGSPSDGVLQAGDVIIAVNDSRIQHRDEFLSYMTRYVTPGDDVMLTVRRQDDIKDIIVGTVVADDETNRPILGIAVQDAYHIALEQGLSLAAYIAHAGGPSHGAMLTLALYDQLTEGDVTKGLHIAGTGTIEYDGRIGMVGGIPQKAYAVGRTDADVFFVPLAGVEAAKAAAPHLNVVGVERFEDVLSWLLQH